VEADGRRFLVGATDHRIDLLTELDAEQREVDDFTEEPVTALVPSQDTGPWTSPIDALRNMTVRKPTRPGSTRAHHRP
jgi:flagellar biogenesis protein FliO